MRILIDTNILIDFYAARPEYFDNAVSIMKACAEKQIDGCIAAHSVTNAFFILRKTLTLAERRSTLKDLCKIVTVVGIDKEKLKEPETRKFMQLVFRDGFFRTTGTDFEKILPPVSRFGGGGSREKKKQTVIDKLKDFFERYFSISGKTEFTEKSE